MRCHDWGLVLVLAEINDHEYTEYRVSHLQHAASYSSHVHVYLRTTNIRLCQQQSSYDCNRLSSASPDQSQLHTQTHRDIQRDRQSERQWQPFVVLTVGWWSGVVVRALASINEVNQRRARLVLRRVTVSGFNSRCRIFISVCNQPATQGQLSLPSLRGR